LFHRLVELNSSDNAKTVTCDIILDPGRTLKGMVIDQDGKPLSGARISGLRNYGHSPSYWEPEPLRTGEFAMFGVKPGQRRRLIVVHDGQRLAGSLLIEGNEKEPLKVQVRPWATVTGRVVDADGQPKPGLDLLFAFGHRSRDFTIGIHPAGPFATDRQGKFRIEGLVPELQYLLLIANRRMSSDYISLRLKSGESRDLGDVLLKLAN
jgi:hypothetical protein